MVSVNMKSSNMNVLFVAISQYISHMIFNIRQNDI